MESLFQRIVRKKGRDYRVDFSFDDEALVESTAGFEIKAGVRESGAEDWVEVTLRVEVNFDLGIIILSRDGHEIAKIPLTLPIDDIRNFEGEDFDVDADDTLIDGAIGKPGIDEIIHLLPADPVLGCIIKSVASTAIGQIIRCWRPARDVRPYKKLASSICGCMCEYKLRMLVTFMWRCGRCMASCGLM